MLACIIFITTTGFQVSAHYCAGQLRSLKLFGQAENCMMPVNQVKSCYLQMVSQVNKMACCNDADLQIQQNSYEAAHVAKLSIDPVYYYFQDIQLGEVFHVFPDRSQDFIVLYRPPPIERNIPVLVQSFLL